MDNWSQSTTGPRQRLLQRCRRVRTLPQRLVVPGVLLLGSLAAHGQAVGPLVINPIADTNIMPGTTLRITVSVTNTAGIIGNQLNWTLPSAPAGASITNSSPPNTALFTWQPTSAQAPSTNTIIVQVQDLANPTNITSTSFRVNVFTNAVATPPFLTPINDSTIVAGQLFTFTNSAHTTDGTTNALVYSLEPGAPDGASITADTGVFTWTPTAQQADVYSIGVTVTEQSTTQLSSTEFFNLTVILTNNCAGFDDFVAAVEQGGIVPLPDCPIIVLSNTLVIANDVTLDAGSAGTVITGNTLIRLFTVLAPATLTLSGLTLSGGLSTNGGAILVEAGAQTFISNCSFRGNAALGSNGLAGADGSASSSGIGGNGKNGGKGGSGWGGAIFNAGDLTLTSCQFLTNRAAGGNGGKGGGGASGASRGGDGGSGGGGATALGGAVYNAGTLWISDCSFEGNTTVGGSGGADLMLDWRASVARGLRARELACIVRRPRLQPSRTAPSRAILQAVATAHRAALSQMASGATARAGATAWVRASAALAQALSPTVLCLPIT